MMTCTCSLCIGSTQPDLLQQLVAEKDRGEFCSVKYIVIVVNEARSMLTGPDAKLGRSLKEDCVLLELAFKVPQLAAVLISDATQKGGKKRVKKELTPEEEALDKVRATTVDSPITVRLLCGIISQ
jgi:hypothetical protein